jgi:hypothetical protein
MPASMHPIFPHPDDKGALIWRYMDFVKYVSMLEHNGLYMCRSDLLGDPFEGSVSQLNVEAERFFFLGGHMPGLNKEVAEGVLARYSNVRRSFRKLIYLNCWYLSPFESAAMWGLYARTAEAIAIQSNFTNLFNCLPESHYVGLVKYADYKLEALRSGNLLFPFLYKRKSYEHEHELRVVHLLLPEQGQDFFERDTPTGIWTSVNLSQLIARIYVSPSSPQWFRELVQNVSKKYGLSASVLQSDLDAEPIF